MISTSGLQISFSVRSENFSEDGQRANQHFIIGVHRGLEYPRRYGLLSADSNTRDGTPPKQAKDDPRFSLKGNTLRVYMHILRNNSDSIGVRGVQKDLGFSSPTLAKYHLEKLKGMGLLKFDEGTGDYSLLKEVKVDVLQPFISFGSFIIPRLFTYAVMISVLFAYVLLVVIPSQNFHELEFFSLVIGGVSLGAFWYETLRSWRNSPE